MLVRIGIAATIIGVSTKTLRRWEKVGRIKPTRTLGNHRRYDKEALISFKTTQQYQPTEKPHNNVAIYARVSASRQKEDLRRQMDYLREKAKFLGAERVIEYQDIASGLSDTRKGLKRLLRDASQGSFRAVIVTYGDRLSRFGQQLIKEMLQNYGVQL